MATGPAAAHPSPAAPAALAASAKVKVYAGFNQQALRKDTHQQCDWCESHQGKHNMLHVAFCPVLPQGQGGTWIEALNGIQKHFESSLANLKLTNAPC